MGETGMASLMALYSLALVLVFVLGSPYWAFCMLNSGRYRAGLWGRLGRVPDALRRVVAAKQVVWLHAVSVGEVLAATRLVSELESALNDSSAQLPGNWIIVVSTTTATGQALAQDRFGASRTESGLDKGNSRVFWYPLDFGWSVRRYLTALRPRLLVLMESELWPRMLVECERAGVPVAVVNARVSDRSFARGVKLRRVWQHVLGKVSLFAAQTEEDERRLIAMGAATHCVLATGNLKYDVRPPNIGPMAERIREIAAGRKIFVAGSTVAGERGGPSEDELVIRTWKTEVLPRSSALLVIAPRHPQRFGEVAGLLSGMKVARASELNHQGSDAGADVVLLDTIGDLAGVYSVATVAFIGGSLIARGGHNPLEAARFAVPVITGPFTNNFREVYLKLAEADGVVTVASDQELGRAAAALLNDPARARATGENGQRIYEREQGATGRTVSALIDLLRGGRQKCG
jgi:3-deoxy-D-manno-octulosonic-acid transferase